ncbi:hypothetical protein EBU71_06165 [bacterium]|nr:hypothetical protein [Candidatus Elulimicrobium humile]
MSVITRYSDTCKVKQADSNKTVEAVIQEFVEHSKLIVILNKSVKLSMKWNGKVYEGRMAGLDFVSDGPVVSKTQTGIRGV